MDIGGVGTYTQAADCIEFRPIS